jgi:glycosyltransferase involved in cell wall biosynthesis
MDYPRTLFVTPHAFNHLTGGGITFSNLFRGWPQDRLGTVHNDYIPTTDDVCTQYYRLGRSELDLWEPIRRVADQFRMAPARDIAAAESTTIAEPTSVPPDWMRRIQRLLTDAEMPRSAHLTSALESWIDAFRPDVLYTILGSNGFMDLVELIRRRFRLPMVVHIMDDWASSAHRRGLLSPLQRRGMKRRLSHAYNAAHTRLAISDAMAQAYGRRYGQPFSAIHNGIDTQRWQALARSTPLASSEGRILYVGSVMPHAQLDSLALCCRAVAELSDAGQRISLSIASPRFQIEPVRGRLAIHPAIQIIGPIEDDAAFFRSIATADALLLPVNFDADSIRFIRFSMPTKVPAYLFSGTPVLAFSPAGVAQTEYAREAGWGLVVDRPDMATLKASLLEILHNVELRERLSRTAQDLAATRHELSVVRQEFKSYLAQAAGAGVKA